MSKIAFEKIKTWFVTGASSGVGKELCRQLLEKGYNVIAVSRRMPDFQHENVLCLSVDVTDIFSIENAVKAGIEKFGKIDVLANNAGISSYLTVEEESTEEVRRIMETNFWGTYNTVKVMLPHFRENMNGTIVNNSSECGIIPRAFGIGYCASKHAVEALSGTLRLETKRFCRVMTVNLSFFQGTEIGKGKPRAATQYDVYKKLPWLPLTVKEKCVNDVKIAVKHIIEAVEEEKLQERLMLGKDIIPKIEYQINSLKRDLESSRSRAESCSTVISANSEKTDYVIVNYWDSFFNYGALLTAYALQELIKSLGYSVKILNTEQRTERKWFKNSFMEKFSRQYLLLTPQLTYAQVKKLAKNVKGFILGSDQVLRPQYMEDNLKKYLLSFADPQNKKIVLSGSFGVGQQEYLDSDEVKNKMIFALLKKSYLSFDYLSCREFDGIDIFKNLFGCSANFMADPVFLVKPEVFDNIKVQTEQTYSEKIVCFFLDQANCNHEKLNELKEKSGYEICQIDRIKSHLDVGSWLKAIKECKLFMTDSFHGVCFAIIFNKSFICVRNKSRGESRFNSLQKTFTINDRFVDGMDNLSDITNYFTMDFKDINSVISAQRERCIAEISTVLSAENTVSAEKRRIKKYINAIDRQKYLHDYWRYFKYRLLANFASGERKNFYRSQKIFYKKQLSNGTFIYPDK